MLFSSYAFIFIFLPLLVVLYYIVPQSWRNYVLLLASLGFYSWGGLKYLMVMLVSIAINYVCGILLELKQNHKLIVVLAVILNLLLLGYYKYTDFFIVNLNNISGMNIPLRQIVLPIGISFYTFQGLSYVIDVSRGKGKALKNPLKLALYISLFPQLIAGPIVRYETIADQIDNRSADKDEIEKGIYRFVIGLSKKVLLANTIGELAAVCFGTGIENLTIASAWYGAIAFTLQIYFDFSGYSDMAIGLGHIFGFSFMENFNYPYISDSITEFWRRWHISLSTWFRDYVYIPLGGNRRGISRQILNLLIVWALTGMWHGASWNFIAWGLYYAILLIIEKFIIQRNNIKLPKALAHVVTLVLVIMGWVLFESPTLTYAMQYIGAMFNVHRNAAIIGTQFLHMGQEYGVLLILGCIGATPVAKKIAEKPRIIPFVILLGLCIMRLVVSSYNPFIYFRF